VGSRFDPDRRRNILFVYTTYVGGTECSETSAHKIQTPGELPKRKNNTGEEVVLRSDHTGSSVDPASNGMKFRVQRRQYTDPYLHSTIRTQGAVFKYIDMSAGIFSGVDQTPTELALRVANLVIWCNKT
jgi:hypothetical protein